jgi:hypothetical protein
MVPLVLVCSQLLAAQPLPGGLRVSQAQGEALALAALSNSQRQLPSLEAVPGEGGNPRYMYFTVTWKGAGAASVVVGVYAVDVYTADVFSAAAECLEYHNHQLSALQAKIRSSLRLSPKAYLLKRAKGPLCSE